MEPYTEKTPVFFFYAKTENGRSHFEEGSGSREESLFRRLLRLDESSERKAYPAWKVYVVEISTEQLARSILLPCRVQQSV